MGRAGESAPDPMYTSDGDEAPTSEGVHTNDDTRDGVTPNARKKVKMIPHQKSYFLKVRFWVKSQIALSQSTIWAEIVLLKSTIWSKIALSKSTILA